jgi:hypothetical protein
MGFHTVSSVSLVLLWRLASVPLASRHSSTSDTPVMHLDGLKLFERGGERQKMTAKANFWI